MFNPERFRRKTYSTEAYLEGILAGDRVRLSQAITLIESQRPEDQAQAQALIEACLPHSGKAWRLGITGTPGVGKSSFIEAFGLYLVREQGQRLAVLAIDPSSQRSGGAILGDKTRMAQLSVCPEVYIRPSAAGAALGGVARHTRETIILCEAAGYGGIIVETVGVGQSEVAVQSMVDFFLLLLLPNAGDELQGIKRGVMELADLIAINKADAQPQQAEIARRQCLNALHLFPPKASGIAVEALAISALQGQGLAEIWAILQGFFAQKTDFIRQQRQEQAHFWLEDTIRQGLEQRFYAQPEVQAAWQIWLARIRQEQSSPFRAAEELLRLFAP